MENTMSLSEMLTYSTVLIRCEYADGTVGTGTGFIIDLCKDENNMCIPVLITNNHVVNNSIKTQFEFCKADNSGKPIDTDSYSLTYNGTNHWIHHPDKSVDLCCLPIGQALNEMKNNNINIFYIPLETNIIPNANKIEDLAAMEDVVMVGYPIGLSDGYNHKPIIRKGITATHPKKQYQGKDEFLVDMACFPGSSGSPIFILNQGSYSTRNSIVMGNRIYFLGVLYGGPQYSATGVISFNQIPNLPRAQTNIPTNIGIAIKSQKILDFENIFKFSQNGGNING